MAHPPQARRTVRIAVAVILQDAGEATRAIELAKAIRAHAPEGWHSEFIFLSHGPGFTQAVLDAGFLLHHCQPQLEGLGLRKDCHSTRNEIVGSPELARDLILGELDALREIKPDLLLQGFTPWGNIARQMLGLPAVGFCSIPLCREAFLSREFLRDTPDFIWPLTYLPRRARRALIRLMPRSLMFRGGFFPQHNVRVGAEMAGWKGRPLRYVWEMVRADVEIINDYPGFYTRVRLPESFHITGPVFASVDEAASAEVDPEITRLFSSNSGKPRIFCSLGSTGLKATLLEVIKAVSTGKAKEEGWRAVVLVPASICSMAEARAACGKVADGDAPNVYLTDKFVPAPSINAMADVTVSHGGQGTIQTAVSSGTPIVGVAMMMEQQINLDHVMDAGAAIRIPFNRWTAANIQRAIGRVVGDPSYRERARLLQREFAGIDGQGNAARLAWEFVMQHVSKRE